MKTALFLLTLIAIAPLAAQSGSVLSVEPATVAKEIAVDFLDEDFEDITSLVVTNRSNRTVQLVREIVRRPQPRAWRYRDMDRISRTSPYLDQRTALPPGESAVFYVALRPDGMTGTGTTELRFSDLTLPGTVLARAEVTTTVVQRVAESEEVASADVPPTSLRLYPNPAADRFYLEAPRGTTVGRIEVTNTLGRQLKSYGRSQSKGYDIADLPDGLYLISVYDASGKKLKTLRLLHRRPGA